MRGITPIVSVILLLLITISIVGFAMLFFQRTAQSAGEETETQLQQQLSAIGERFEIVSVDQNKVYVKNTGTANLQNLRFYVDGNEVSATVAPIAPNTVGEAALTGPQLAMLPGDKLRVTSVGYAQEQKSDFYAKNTVAYWRFDEADRDKIKDYSGNGNDGTFSGESWNDGTVIGAVQTDGKYGKAMRFDGADDYIEIPDSPSNSFTGPFSIELWVNINNFGDDAGYPGNPIIAKGNRAANQPGAAYNMRTTSTGQVVFDVVDNSAGARIGALTTKTLAINTWYHIVGTWDGGITTSSTRVFINGEEWFGKDSNRVFRSLQDSNQVVQIGRNMDGASVGFFNGIIDEVRIYNKALSPQEILEDMNSPYPVARTVASYSFEKFTDDGKAQDTHNIVKGRYGAAMSLDGIDDFIIIPNSPTTNFGTGPFTLSTWVRTSSPTSGIIIETSTKAGVYDQMKRLAIENNGKNIAFYARSSGGNPDLSVNVNLNDGTWHYVAGTYDSNVRKLYFGESSVGSDTSTIGNTDTTQPWRIGSALEGSTDLTGFIDEIRILNDAIA